MRGSEFLKLAIKDYRVGAITASSRFAVRRIVGNLGRSTYVVEYGSGDGVITKEILRKMPQDGRLVVFEINQNFLPELEDILDSRLVVKNANVAHFSGNAADLGLPHIDTVISGIPFSFFDAAVREKIIRNTHRALAPGGIFIVYQYSPLILPILKRYFGRVTVKIEPRNLPPYFIMRAEK